MVGRLPRGDSHYATGTRTVSFADLLVEQRLLLFVVVLQIIFHALNFLLNERVVLRRRLGLVTLQFKLKPLGIAQQFSAVILRLFQLNLDEPLQQWRTE